MANVNQENNEEFEVDGNNLAITVPLQTLFKFIKPFDGDRQKLIPYLNAVDAAFRIASPDQIDILLAYTKTQLNGKAEAAASNHDFNTWVELKNFLKSIYADSKHHGHLLIELLSCKQLPTEQISQYICRVETALKRLLTSTQQNTTIPAELPGRLAAMNDLALHTFILNIKPDISSMLRARNIENLNEAFNLAIEEEKVQLLIKLKQSNFKSTECSICHKLGHTANQCFKKPSTTKPILYTTSNDVNNSCKYCKKVGHNIQECRKLKWKKEQDLKNSSNSSNRSENIRTLETNAAGFRAEIMTAASE